MGKPSSWPTRPLTTEGPCASTDSSFRLDLDLGRSYPGGRLQPFLGLWDLIGRGSRIVTIKSRSCCLCRRLSIVCAPSKRKRTGRSRRHSHFMPPRSESCHRIVCSLQNSVGVVASAGEPQVGPNPATFGGPRLSFRTAQRGVWRHGHRAISGLAVTVPRAREPSWPSYSRRRRSTDRDREGIRSQSKAGTESPAT